MAYDLPKITDRAIRIREEYDLSQMASYEDQYKIMHKEERERFYYAADRLHSIAFIEAWRNNEKRETSLLRRAYAEAEVLANSKPIITDHELLVGQPEPIMYTEEDQKRLDQLISDFHLAPFIDPASRADHLSMDYDKLLRVGVQGLIDEIETRRSELELDFGINVPENTKKDEFYEGCLAELRALLKCAENYATHARELASKSNSSRKEELLEIASILDRVPRYPAKSFREALQSVTFYLHSLTGCIMAGRPDRYLLPYYTEDLEKGTISRESAQELIDNFCMQFRTRMLSRSTCGIALGGVDSKEQVVENDLTYMFLNSILHNKHPLPSVALAVSEKHSDDLLRFALSIIAEGNGNPTLFNDEFISKALQERGYSVEDSHNFINTTCVEISICGKTAMWTTCPWVNLAKLFLETIQQKKDYHSVDEIIADFTVHVRNHIVQNQRYFNRLQLERSRNGCEPLLISCLMDDCIAKGRGIYDGGAVYHDTSPAFVGVGNVIDSLIAIDTLVYQSKTLSLQKLNQMIQDNYEGNEYMRQFIVNKIPKYGTNHPEADQMAIRINNMLLQSCEGLTNFFGGDVIAANFTYFMQWRMGMNTPATPDGRKMGEALADSAGPVQGRDKKGVTSRILSTTSWDQYRFVGGVSENFRLNRSLLTDHNGDKAVGILRTYFKRGGIQMQINAISQEILKAAQEDPEQYADLQVRVGGYSDYYVRLPKYLQDEIMSRTEVE